VARMTDDDTHEGQLEVGAETALVSVSLGPGQVGELGVGRDTNDLGVDSGELVEGGVEREDLGGADDCWRNGLQDVRMRYGKMKWDQVGARKTSQP